jgi:endonuclease/exonuclease/phosphatase (EEP) superfamily protein YafD
MFRRVFVAIVTLVAAAVLLVLVWPSLFGLERTPGIAQVIAFRIPTLLVGAVLAVIFLLVAAGSRRSRRLAGSLALVLVLFVALESVVVLDRGIGDPDFAAKDTGDVTVLSWNTLGGEPGAATVADLAILNDADVITLPETTADFGAEVASLLAASGKPMQQFSKAYDEISKARSTTLLVSEALGPYAVDESIGSTKQLPSVIARPVSGTGPAFAAMHPVAPVPDLLDTWSSDLDWLATACSGGSVIMAGDFNSTLDHWSHVLHDSGAAIGGCFDAAAATGNAAVGTWPTSVPALLGTPIDHVLATNDWRVSGMRVVESVDDAGSDHRPVVAQLTRVDS